MKVPCAYVAPPLHRQHPQQTRRRSRRPCGASHRTRHEMGMAAGAQDRGDRQGAASHRAPATRRGPSTPSPRLPVAPRNGATGRILLLRVWARKRWRFSGQDVRAVMAGAAMGRAQSLTRCAATPAGDGDSVVHFKIDVEGSVRDYEIAVAELFAKRFEPGQPAQPDGGEGRLQGA